jgi:DNA-binding MarR family transcriptional regulator
MNALWGLDHALRSASKRMRSRFGITGPQRLVIRMVGKYPGLDAGELAGLLRLHPSTLTGIVARLEKGRYVIRWVDPEDARRFRFRLTPRGEAMDRTRSGTVEAALRRALNEIPEDHVRITRQVLEILAQELEAT